MNPLIQYETKILPLLIGLSLACFALLPTAHAIRPSPDGDYPRDNTAEGEDSLFSMDNRDSSGESNTAVGWHSLHAVTESSDNTGVGAGTLLANTGFDNTATGSHALASNTDGSFNTAVGSRTLHETTLGTFNTAIGRDALYFNTTGGNNTAVGFGALENHRTGTQNTALGYFAGVNVTTAVNVISIGSSGANVNNSTWIGNIYGIIPQSGITAPVVVSDGGQLGTVASSERFKKDIAAMDKASEIILSLRPVTFHYKSDARETPQFGLIAEEVAKVNPALVLPDKEGKPYTVRYDAVNAMLLNEFLKEHRKMEEQEETIAQLKKELRATAAHQQHQIDALTAGLQKVSAQLEVSKPAPQTVKNTD